MPQRVGVPCQGGIERGGRAALLSSTRVWGEALGEVLGLLLPLACAGCGRWDVALCAACEDLLRAAPRRCETGAPALAGVMPPAGSAAGGSSSALATWCVAGYSGPARGVVLAWKGNGERTVARAVRAAGVRAGRALAPELAAAELLPASRLVVVPAPSGWRRRAAGRFVVGSLGVAVARGLTEGLAGGPQPEQRRPDVVVMDALRRGRGSAHQAGLGAAGRSANRRRSMRLVRPLPSASTCLLVDDVVTTGATLAESRRTLEAGGHRVVGAFVLASARLPTDRSHGTS